MMGFIPSEGKPGDSGFSRWGRIWWGIFIGMSVILAFSFFLSGCSQPKKSKEPIRIGINVWAGYAHAFIAQEKGLFKKNKVDVKLILCRKYTESQDLYLNGEIDGVFEVFPDTIFHNAEGIPTRVVYIADFSDSGDVIIGRPEFQSLSDLKGKKVGIGGINNFSHLFVYKALEKSGLSEVEMRFALIPAEEVLTDLEEGRIAAGHTWEPFLSAALKKGYRILGKAGQVPGIITDVLVFNSRVIAERPDDITAIVRSLFEARDFLITNRDEALDIIVQQEEMGKEELNQGLSGIHQLDVWENAMNMKKNGQQDSLYTLGTAIIQFYLDRGQLSRIPRLEEIIDPVFVDQVAPRSSP
ncbi:MAG: ABC transporter substrate-binding protein [Atribacterota bacterium]